jgi:hypothetical protein
MQCHPVGILREPDAATVGQDMVGTEPFERCLVQHPVQPAAMHADFRYRIPGEAAARFAIDQLAKAVEEAALLVLDAERFEALLQAEPRQFAHRMRQERDADPELLDLGHRLVDPALEAALPQIEREAEPDDAAADDGNLHPSSPSGCAAIVGARWNEDKQHGSRGA